MRVNKNKIKKKLIKIPMMVEISIKIVKEIHIVKKIIIKNIKKIDKFIKKMIKTVPLMNIEDREINIIKYKEMR